MLDVDNVRLTKLRGRRERLPYQPGLEGKGEQEVPGETPHL